MSILMAVIGWAGAALLLYGYAMVSSSRMSGDGTPYQLINLAGALGLMINSAYQGAWPSAILNVVWTGIGVAALIKLSRVKAPR
ncbi:hypothetical protein ACIBH1_07320 [Nonomuraea sp. NPDC050663]|uniref:CBU_0592 family membrane protein n=1 Tax=Nonomuraea sp. NPDC050663 TaxID=3364370 RepID=UPI003787F0F3